ncbi:hypothetical protein Sango_1775400 [Sesamum angolense]|uniref:NADH-ubiquinone reductase complex 1 MLRQ subunit n=1 Tax=Sesamum angolense TaxID=2727404 RepID=A0AAE1WH51_9LAMI|nr:hypothetical protein Sango_1775400 [Sesamum angolense]
MASSTTLKRWLRPEVYPLFAAVGVAVGICGMQLVRNICINPEVRVTKENRAAGVLDNFAEGEKYAETALRKLFATELQKSCHPLTVSSPILNIDLLLITIVSKSIVIIENALFISNWPPKHKGDLEHSRNISVAFFFTCGYLWINLISQDCKE